jgi:UDP:flavonoid glycosyltransferase YjiC (YdhE family)
VNFDMLLGVMTGCEARRQKLALLSTCISMFPLPGIPPFGAGLAPARTEAERALHAEIAAAATALFDSGLPALNAARSTLGLAPLAHVLDQANAAHLRLLGTARAFDFPSDELPSYVRYVGPLIRDPVWARPWVSPWPADDRRPLVVIGFSTSFQNHAACLQRLIDACASLPVRVLVTLGGSIRRDELRPASNTAIVDSAPHNVVMRDARIVVTHGGHGTVMTALMHRVPLLVLPHGRDQGDNAVRVTERGAGLSLASTASMEEMHAALARLIDEPSFRIAAQRLGDAVTQEVESSRVVEELEGLAAAADSRSALR